MYTYCGHSIVGFPPALRASSCTRGSAKRGSWHAAPQSPLCRVAHSQGTTPSSRARHAPLTAEEGPAAGDGQALPTTGTVAEQEQEQGEAAEQVSAEAFVKGVWACGEGEVPAPEPRGTEKAGEQEEEEQEAD